MTARVGLNVTWLVPDVVGGSETSTVTTLAAIAAAPPDDLTHVLYALEPFVERYPEVAAAFETHVLPLSGRMKGARVVAEQTWLQVRARRDRLDLLHHLGGTMPLVGGPPAVLSIHDLQPFDHPDHFHRVKRAWLGVAVPRSVARARLVLVPSEWVRGTVVERFAVDPARVVSIPHGIPDLAGGTPFPELRSRYDLPAGIVVYPAITYPHKDHVTLVRAFAALAAEHPDVDLVLTGGDGPAEPEVRAAIAASGAAPRIHRLGTVPRADAVGLIDASLVVAVPSLYEGFGIPAVEGMARGRAVLAADATGIPEVVGTAARLAPGGDVGAWTGALDELLARPDIRADLGERGRRRVADLSAARNAAATLDAHRRALSGDPTRPTPRAGGEPGHD